MIIIKGVFSYIEIPDGTEFSISSRDFPSDEKGNPLEVSSENAYECGDLIIRTNYVEYTFKRIMDCYIECMELNRYIFKQRKLGEKDIFIDLEELLPGMADAELVMERW